MARARSSTYTSTYTRLHVVTLGYIRDIAYPRGYAMSLPHTRHTFERLALPESIGLFETVIHASFHPLSIKEGAIGGGEINDVRVAPGILVHLRHPFSQHHLPNATPFHSTSPYFPSSRRLPHIFLLDSPPLSDPPTHTQASTDTDTDTDRQTDRQTDKQTDRVTRDGCVIWTSEA